MDINNRKDNNFILRGTRGLSHDDIFRIVTEIISQITKIPTEKIYPKSHLEFDLRLYENGGYLLPDPKLWELLLRIELRFKLDSKRMDCKYNALFDPQIQGTPTVWRLVELIKEELGSQKVITS